MKQSKSSVTSLNIYRSFHLENEETVEGKEDFESQGLLQLYPAGHAHGLPLAPSPINIS
jgi:hypothetical protein